MYLFSSLILLMVIVYYCDGYWTGYRPTILGRDPLTWGPALQGSAGRRKRLFDDMANSGATNIVNTVDNII